MTARLRGARRCRVTDVVCLHGLVDTGATCPGVAAALGGRPIAALRPPYQAAAGGRCAG